MQTRLEMSALMPGASTLMKLEEYDAQVEYLKQVFLLTRTTEVETVIAVIYVDIRAGQVWIV